MKEPMYKEFEGQLVSNKEFCEVARLAGVEEGCEKGFGRSINYRQCEACECWGEGGEVVYCTDNGDLCESHLGHTF
jgi:hypothetical protein